MASSPGVSQLTSAVEDAQKKYDAARSIGNGDLIMRMKKELEAAQAALKGYQVSAVGDKSVVTKAVRAMQDPLPTVFKGGHTVKMGGHTGTNSTSVGTINPRQLQQYLKSRGYDLPISGKLDPSTKAALGDFLDPRHTGGAMAQALRGTSITGKRDPKSWNLLFGTAKTKGGPVRPNTGSGGLLDSGGNDISSSYIPAGAQDVDLSQTQALLKSPIGKRLSSSSYGGANLLDSSLAGGGARILDPGVLKGGAQALDPRMAQGGAQLLDTGFADRLASAQFDPAIAAAKSAAEREQHQGVQNLRDVTSWYDQVLAAHGKAAQRDSEINQAGQASVGESNQAILSSLGGAANPGASSVAAAGENNLGTLKSLGVIQDQYNSDVAPLLKAEGAAASTREQAAQSQLAADSSQRIQDLMAQKAAAGMQGSFDIENSNNGILDARAGRALDLAQYNNQVADTHQGQRLGLAQYNNQVKDARAGRLIDIANANNAVLDARAGREFQVDQYNNQLGQQGFNNALALNQAQISAILAGANLVKASKSGTTTKPTGFAALSGTGRVNLMQKLIGSLPTDNSGRLTVEPAQARGVIARVMQAAGYSLKNPQVASFLKNVYANVGV